MLRCAWIRINSAESRGEFHKLGDLPFAHKLSSLFNFSLLELEPEGGKRHPRTAI